MAQVSANLYSQMVSVDIIILCLAAFSAGFVDSIVGGGGLVQLPALMMVLPQFPLISILGTNKLVSVTGTGFAAWRFSRSIPFIRTVMIPTILCAFIFSFFGAYIVTIVDANTLKPIFMVLMFCVFLFTIKNKNLGLVAHDPNIIIPIWKPILIGSVLGFYDGFFGPGTGSFLIIGFVSLMGMTFVQGSAYAKMINLTTNIAALSLFIYKGAFMLEYAIPMALFNVLGSVLGVRLALLKGNDFVRVLLRIIVLATILKLAYQVVTEYIL